MIQSDSSKQTFLRRACDRCHQSKLKCSKESDEEKCQRCLRADVECTFSPPASTPRRQTWSVATLATIETRYREREPASTADLINNIIFDASCTQPDSSSHHVGVNAQCSGLNKDAGVGATWRNTLEFPDCSMKLPEGDIFMDLDECENPRPPVHETSVGSNNPIGKWRPHQVVRQPPDSSAHHSQSTCHTSKSNSLPNYASDVHLNAREIPQGESTNGVEETEHTRTQWLRSIADINIALTEHLDLFSNDNVSNNRVGSRQKEGARCNFTVDQAFRLSQLFIDILGSICAKLPESDKGGDQITNKPRPASFQLDPSAELLVYSAYLRLLETYHRILEYIQAAAKQNHPKRSTAATFQLPSLTVGSFSLSSKSNTQSLVLVNLTETMALKARELITKMSSPKMTPGYRGNFQSFGGVSLVIVPDLALRAIRAREDALSRVIDDLKNSIL